MPALRALRRLSVLRGRYDEGTAAERLRLLRRLDRHALPDAGSVTALHELLCFLHAYPDTPALFRQVSRMLGGFSRRADLRRFRHALQDSGIAGTDTVYAFAAPTARWLVARAPTRVHVEWDLVDQDRLHRHLPLLALYGESPGMDEPPLEGRAWVERLRGRESDAAFLIRAVSALPASESVRDRVYDDLDLSLRLSGGAPAPSRTGARFDRAPLAAVRGPLRRERPDLAAALRRPPDRIRTLDGRDGARLVDLAREAMVTRARDLDAFKWASADDVRLLDCGDGLTFAMLGVVPERRMWLESVYGMLVLQNGVPIGYVLVSALCRSSEVAFNLFESFRDAEAAHVYGRLLGAIYALFGSDTFTVFPYQLGHENDEGLSSGAWWFYYKLGFRPRDRRARALAGREARRAAATRGYRSSAATLRRLARHNVFFEAGPPRHDVIGVMPIDKLGLAVTDLVVKRYAGDRDVAASACAIEVAGWLGVPGWRRWPVSEREAFERLAPLVRLLPEVKRWPATDRRALAQVLRAKGGRRESDFVAAFDGHVRLRAAFARTLTGLRRARRR
jgi:hypothetical protein